MLDNQGRVRDLSGANADVAGAALLPESLARLRDLNIDSLGTQTQVTVQA